LPAGTFTLLPYFAGIQNPQSGNAIRPDYLQHRFDKHDKLEHSFIPTAIK